MSTGDRPELFSPSRIMVDPWPPDYGPAFRPGDDEYELGSVDLDVEVAADDWAPIAPDGAVGVADDVVFIDGTRRTDARLTLVPPSEDHTLFGMAASFAAGSIRCRDGAAEFEVCEVRRGLFARAHSVRLDCGAGVVYEPYAVAEYDDPDQLHAAITTQMRALEGELAATFADDAALVIVDGPLPTGRKAARALGYVKTHHTHHLPESHRPVVAALGEGQRTPMFATGSNYAEFSWYLRLHGANADDPWGGIVRLESPTGLGLASARRLADLSATTLPRFCSRPHRDPRAPQNLVPIAALEDHIRHLLGDPSVLERLLRRACTGWRPA